MSELSISSPVYGKGVARMCDGGGELQFKAVIARAARGYCPATRESAYQAL